MNRQLNEKLSDLISPEPSRSASERAFEGANAGAVVWADPRENEQGTNLERRLNVSGRSSTAIVSYC
jgi:hypothetical protein